jgi:magnesium chelatase family protein
LKWPSASLEAPGSRCWPAGVRAAFVTTRQFRAPHRKISDVGLIGGGQVPLAGEVSRMHHGILFLDELPECRCHVLEVLL